MNKIIRVSLVALLVVVSLVFVNCSKDGKWDSYERWDEIYGFSVVCVNPVFPDRAIGETTEIKINVWTKYKFEKLPMKARVICNSGTGRLKTKTGDIFIPNETYLIKEPYNVFEYVGDDAGIHKFTIEFFNDKRVKKEVVITVNYATMAFGIDFKSMTTGEVYQGDSYDYILKITDPIAPQDNHYIIFTEFSEGNISLNGEDVKLNSPYLLNMAGSNAIRLTSQKSEKIILRYKVKNSNTEREGEDVILEFKQREIKTENFQISSNTIVKNTNDHSISGKVIKTITPSTTKEVFYKVWLTSKPSGYSSGINIDKEGEYKEDVLDGNNQWRIKFNVGNVPTGTYEIGVQFKDEYGNESQAVFFEFNVVSN